ALAEQDVADRRILHCIVLCKIILKCSLSSRCSTFHQLVDVSSAYSDRKQTYCCEHGETSSHVIRHNESLITFLCSQILKSSLRTVCRCIDSLCSLFFTVFLLQNLFKYTEGDRRLCCRS